MLRLLGYRVYLVSGIVLVIFGYLAFRFQSVASPKVDESKLEERQQASEIKKIRFDKDTIAELENRSKTGQSTEPGTAGDPNPFD